MTTQSKSQPFSNACHKIELIYTSLNDEKADLCAAITHEHIKTLHEHQLISPAEKIYLAGELDRAHCNWRTPPKEQSTWAAVRLRIRFTVARCQAWLEEREQRWKTKCLKWVGSAVIFALIATVVIAYLAGFDISMGYLATAVGLLLVAFSVLTRSMYLQNIATLFGVVLVGTWYAYSLFGLFNPVKEVLLNVGGQSGVADVRVLETSDGKDRKQNCQFDTKKGILVCEVNVILSSDTPKS